MNEVTEVFTKTTLGYERCEIRITNLKPFTTYRIAVRAFNSVGPGPDSDFIRITTNEGGKTIMFEMNLSTVGLKTHANQLKMLCSARRTPTKRSVFTVDSRVIANELGSTAHAKSSRHYIRIQNTLQKSESKIR